MFETVFVELNKIHVALKKCLLIKLNGAIAKEGTIPFSRIAAVLIMRSARKYFWLTFFYIDIC